MDLNEQGGEDNMVVVVRNAVKSYGSKEPRVLDELNMNVPRGCIYGLLGASGSGKTTLLKAVIGLLKLDSGQVRVFGINPGEKGAGVPGPRVGYMPQELALVQEFTIANVFFYFGWIYGMTRSEILKQMQFLVDLLDFPTTNELIANLSGGQKRRLSFSVAVMHNPELLILDEPTVGQDPILRKSIWDYMVQISEKKNLTIIITTHYIEEARAAHRVGLLRGGTILAEGSPNYLLDRFNCSSLEEVFLVMSQKQTDHRSNVTASNVSHNQDPDMSSPPLDNVINTNESSTEVAFVSKSTVANDWKTPSSSSHRISAVLYMNWWSFIRNTPGVLFFFTFPAIYIGFFILALGSVLDIPIGIVNEELGNCFSLPGDLETHYSVQPFEDDMCHFRGMSCLFIDKLNTDKVKINFYDTLDAALEATRHGHTYSTLYFEKNFTSAMQHRYDYPADDDGQIINSMSVKVWMDMTDYVIAHSIRKHFIERYIEFQMFIAENCRFSQNFTSSPIRFNAPVFGINNEVLTSSMIPGYMVSVTMMLMLVQSSTTIIAEKLGGIWRRNVAIGVSSTEILVAHLITQICLMLITVTESLLICFYSTEMYLIGSVGTLLTLVILQALTSLALGISLSCVYSSYEAAFGISCGLITFYFFLSGSVWPLEGMHPIVKHVANIFPSNWVHNALNSVLYRGWGLAHPQVYIAVLVSSAWLVVFVAFSVLVLKYYSH